ncbi:hydroxymethylbilane synthase [Polymorphobacter sp. PAMC 29334]|uniref:hydroxymethylbilane synthase n=1 Tax=Polymorphobacter sp. PAMC 29334 TaxID=2862331 RepID=UPI001C77047A|nr:hydroxymethylbilane synthase [Polymorphobacter sp. PAMC 29334]QYE35743.1 hydroxymethylbilane synthase [Polymorphobacter sp. PAMC 29334]
MKTLKLGTRGSPLALAQAHMVRDALVAAHDVAVEIVVVVTTGDRVQDRPLAEIGGKALWTKELDAALLDQRIDLAVHSMKDVETRLADGIVIAAMLPRADVRDRLIGAASLEALPEGARLGTSSPRRAAQLLGERPDIVIVPLRGNVATRLAKIAAGEADATLLAAAGLDRLGIAEGVALPLSTVLPAPAQGAVGMTCREGDDAVAALLAAIDDVPTHSAVLLERRFLAALAADCHSSVAAYAQIEGGRVVFRAEILLPDGSERQGGAFDRSAEDAAAEVDALAAYLLGAASPELRGLFGGQ